MRGLTSGELLALEGNGWFAALAVDPQEALLHHRTVLRMAATRTVAAQGSVPATWFAVAAGALQVSACTAGGAKVVLGRPASTCALTNPRTRSFPPLAAPPRPRSRPG